MGFECSSVELEEGMGGIQIKTTNALFPVAKPGLQQAPLSLISAKLPNVKLIRNLIVI